MKVQTMRFGEIEVMEDAILTFPEGLLGFADYKRYVLIENEELAPLCWLQSVDAEHLAFVVLDPQVVVPDYKPPLSRECAAVLQVESPEDVAILGIVTADPDPRKCTINLQAPILINTRNRLAKQVILLDKRYSIRQPLLDEEGQADEAEADEAETGSTETAA